MGKYDYCSHGTDYNVICDRCGNKFKASMCRMEWTGLFVCTEAGNNCWEERHPQEFVRGIYEDISVPIARPDVSTASLSTPATANLAIAGTFTAGLGLVES